MQSTIAMRTTTLVAMRPMTMDTESTDVRGVPPMTVNMATARTCRSVDPEITSRRQGRLGSLDRSSRSLRSAQAFIYYAR